MQNSNKALVYGVGINDADYFIEKKQRVSGKQKRIWICPYYSAWKELLRRCYCTSFKEKNPTYIGCSVHEEWLTFSNFKKWMETQDWQGKQLDKDILKPGNKVYSPSTCVFVSKALNAFILDSAASRGLFPIGVTMHKARNMIMAQCSNPFSKKKEYLGYFSTPDEAHQAWKKRKHELALIYVGLCADERIAKALHVRYC